MLSYHNNNFKLIAVRSYLRVFVAARNICLILVVYLFMIILFPRDLRYRFDAETSISLLFVYLYFQANLLNWVNYLIYLSSAYFHFPGPIRHHMAVSIVLRWVRTVRGLYPS